MNTFELAIKIAALVMAVVFHEVAHGLAAFRLGDPTAARAHRLTLNPFAHIDILGSIILPLVLLASGSPVLFGWAKPVPFNPAYFQNPRKGIMLVGAAGPLTNLALAALCGIMIRLIGNASTGLALFLGYACVTNVVLGVFNLIPIPPLDGSRVVLGLIPQEWVPGFLAVERFGFILIFALLYLGVLNKIVMPVALFLLNVLIG